MGGVQLDQVQPQPMGAQRAVCEGLAHPCQTGGVQRMRWRLLRAVRHCAGCVGLPATRLVGADLQAALPGHAAGALAPRMGELDADRHRRNLAHAGQHTGQRRLGGVVVQAQVAQRDAPGWLDGCRLQDQQAGARQRQSTEVDEMPVGGLAFVGGVLAHRRDHDAVGKGQRADGKGSEQLAHGVGGEMEMGEWIRTAASHAAAG